ncbi:MAG: T9SS type A sorting domain-containing protein, partial [Flavobacterium sp.]
NYRTTGLNNDGTFDTTFDSDGKQTINIQSDDRCTCIALQPDGKIVLGGFSYPTMSNTSWFAAVRLTSDGQPDASFSGDGKAVAKIGFGNDTVYDMALQPDGKILLAADSYIPNSQDIGVVRFTTAGELDTTFSGDGKFNTTFNNTTDYVNAIAVQPDGKILVGGSFYDASSRKMGLLRLTADGILDTSFSTDGKADYVVPGGNGVSVYDMKLQSTGQILMSGYAQNDFMLARILSGNELGVAQFDSDAAGFYPNPARNEISFKELTNATSIFNANGQKVLDIAAGSISADVSALQTGIYMFETVDASGNIGHRKLIKE